MVIDDILSVVHKQIMTTQPNIGENWYPEFIKMNGKDIISIYNDNRFHRLYPGVKNFPFQKIEKGSIGYIDISKDIKIMIVLDKGSNSFSFKNTPL